MKRTKVLMIGWEFPPVINGGLGIACLGLAKALSKYVDLTIILPKTDANFSLDNVHLIGLNNLDLESLGVTSSYESFAQQVIYSDVRLNPYPANAKRSSILNPQIVHNPSSDNIFAADDLYGNDVMYRIRQFEEYAAAIAETLEFDLIHCHDWMTFPAGMRIKAASGKPLVTHIHSLEFDRAGAESKNEVYEIERQAMLQADIVVPVSNYTGTIAQSHYGIDATKLYPVHNGVETVKVYKEKKDFPEKLVLFLGRLTEQKGPQYFLDIASKVIPHVPNVRFVMAGTGDQLGDLIEHGAYKNIGTKFHFTGFLNKEKVQHLLAMTDVYCMPSVSEPFGLSALEAAQFGIPCVISKQSGVSEVLFGALKADYWDIDKMASHIISLLHNQALREAVVRDAYNDIKTCTWERAADKVIDIYKRLK